MTLNWRVAKFGGSSVKDASAMRNCVKLAIERNAHFVVSSATQGTTNQLVDLCSLTQDWTQMQKSIAIIRERHLQIASELEASAEVNAAIEKYCVNLGSLCHGIELLNDCSAKLRDRILCLGELLSTTLLTEAFRKTGKKAIFLDARSVLKTDSRFGKANPQIEEIAKLAKVNIPAMEENCFIITQGFIGSDEFGSTTTLGRGGSDYSAALFAEALDAEQVEIWTDVNGVASTDPRIYPAAKTIKEMTFREASELATFGAKVLHPTTIWPSMRKGFPVFVGSTLDPNAGGTWIRANVEDKPLIRAISVKTKQSFLTISTPAMSHSYGFLAKVFNVFKDHELSIDTVTTSEISIGVTVDDEELENTKLLEDLHALGTVEIESQLSLVSVVGNHIRHTPGLLESLLQTIKDINLRSICGGASKHQVCFLVDSSQASDCVKKIHGSFVPL